MIVFPPRYEPQAKLGKGGGGEVWAVRDRITHRTVALKALGENADEREMLALVREAVALSGLEGFGVPRVLRFGRLAESGRSYLVRELVEGESLAELIVKKGDLAIVFGAIAQAADQLTSLHRALLLHGDIKPANIIVSKDGLATLVDLGLAATWKEGGARPEGLTPKYAAPELFDGLPLTVRAEVFALGATLGDAIRANGERIEAGLLRALEQVVIRATAEDPSARYPSADELASALRKAAKLGERSEQRKVAWPIVGLDDATARLAQQIGALREGGGVVVVGPRASGRSTLLRRIAWSLGVEGRAVAWIEAATVASASEALAIELSPTPDPRGVLLLVDDGDRLDDAALAKIAEARAKGARVVVSVGADRSASLPGPTFEVFAMTPLAEDDAGTLVRRAIPSLSDAVVKHVVARAERWPGRLRAIVGALAKAPVVAPADVDRLLEREPPSSREGRGPASIAERRTEIARLLDRGHYDEAAELLARHKDDPSPAIAVARARLYANQGEAARALAELERVEDEVLASGDVELEASFSLNSARAHLRGGDYVEAERIASRASERAGDDAKLRAIAAEAVVVRGLALSFQAKHADARATMEDAVVRARAVAEPRILSLALGSLAFALQRDEHLDEAKVAYEESLGAAEEAGDAGTVATARLNLASIAKTHGDLAGAIRHLEAAVDMGRRSGRHATLRQALLNLANLELYLGRLARARVSLDALFTPGQEGSLPPQQHAQLLALEAEYAARSGDLAAADRLCGECAAAYLAMGRTSDEAEARIERILYATSAPNAKASFDKAKVLHELGRATELLAGTTAHKTALALARGRVAALSDEDETAKKAYDEAFETARASGQKDWIWRALEARAALALETGQPQHARRDREAALDVLEEVGAKLPRDLREVFWNDSRRHAVRAAALLEIASSPTVATTSSTPTGEDRLARVLEINRVITGEYDLERLLEKVTDNAVTLLRAERGFVILRSGYYARRDLSSITSSRVESKRSSSISQHDPSSDLSIFTSRADGSDDPHARFSQSIAERVIQSGEPIVTTSAREDKRMADYVSVHQLMLQSIACVPIRSRNAATIGALYLETRLRPASTFSDEMPILVAFADQVAIAIETARLVGENEMRRLELERTNAELVVARDKLEQLLGHRTAQLQQTKDDLKKTRAVLRSHFGYEGLVGTSDAMRRVYALVDRLKGTDVPVLIQGESGTGKEVVARAIHNAGARAKKSFVGINCGAIPENLLESELFGHVRGAFTGADRDRPGLFREASLGTILLDEIGEMPAKMQAGLLRVLQEKVVRPVGGVKEEPVDTRVIAATHRDLAQMVANGTFREDLYYRLNVILVRVPPLRERIDDIPILIDHFLGIFAARYSRDRRSVSRGALKRLMAFSWPGNVRQLENVLLNAWVLSEKDELEDDDFELPNAPLAAGSSPRASAISSTQPIGERSPSVTSLDAHRADERERIVRALTSCNWNRVKAAQIVGMPRRTFYRRLKEYGIQ